MTSDALFGLSMLMSLLAFAIVTRIYVWPRLRVMRGPDVFIPFVIPHTFRFLGLSFLIPGLYRRRFHRRSAFRPRTAIWWQPFLRTSRHWPLPLAHPGRFSSSGCSTCGARSISCAQSTRAKLASESTQDRSGRPL